MSWAKHAVKKKADGKPVQPSAQNLGSPSDSSQNSPLHPNSRKMQTSPQETQQNVGSSDGIPVPSP